MQHRPILHIVLILSTKMTHHFSNPRFWRVHMEACSANHSVRMSPNNESMIVKQDKPVRRPESNIVWQFHRTKRFFTFPTLSAIQS